jgi:hypothetical protein
VFSQELDALRAKRICFGCVGEQYLSSEIRAEGKRAKCNYCGKMRRTYSVGSLAERFEAAFEQHYVRSSDQPNDFEFMLLPIASRATNGIALASPSLTRL